MFVTRTHAVDNNIHVWRVGNGASVFKWDPPDGVPKEARLAWSKAKREVLAEVAKFQQGGAALVSFLRGKDEVNHVLHPFFSLKLVETAWRKLKRFSPFIARQCHYFFAQSLRKTQQQIFGGMWYVPPSVKDTEAAKIPVKAESGNKPAGNSDNSPCGSIPCVFSFVNACVVYEPRNFAHSDTRHQKRTGILAVR